MFDYTDVIEPDEEDTPGAPPNSHEAPVLPGAHTIERFLIDQQLAILMETLNFNRILCAHAMLNLRTRARIPLEYMIVEAVFASMLMLPYPPVRHGNLLFYGSLLIQLCHAATQTMPLVLAQATELLYERLDTMKPVCIERLIEWFSHHLSNYQLQWSWREWSGALSEDPMSSHRRFITETLSRLIRFSYYENVKRPLPRSFYTLLPPPAVVINKYAVYPDRPSGRLFVRFVDAIKARTDVDGMLKLVGKCNSITRKSLDADKRPSSPDDSFGEEEDAERLHGSPATGRVAKRSPMATDSDSGASSDEERHAEVKNRPLVAAKRRLGDNVSAEDKSGDVLPSTVSPEGGATNLSPGVTSPIVEAFFSALLVTGCKTISHAFALIKRYSQVIRTVASAVETQVQALHVLQSVWAKQPQLIVVLVEHLLWTGLIDPEAIVRWAYSPSMTVLTDTPADTAHAFARPRILEFYVWECLGYTLRRVGSCVTRITEKLETAKEASMEVNRRRQVSSSPETHDDDAEVGLNRRSKGTSEESRRQKKNSSKDDRRDGASGYQLLSSDDDEEDTYGSGNRVARLEEARCEAVRSQCAVITLLLHRHSRLIAELLAIETNARGQPAARSSLATPFTSSALASASSLVNPGMEELIEGLAPETLRHINFWLKGRLVQVVLEHHEQLVPYLDNLDELICSAHPEVQKVFQQLRALYA